MSTSYLRYLHTAQEVLKQIEATQTEAIAQVSEMCAETIAADGLVYLFGSGHSRMLLKKCSHATAAFQLLSYRRISGYISQSSCRLQRSTASTLFGKRVRLCRSHLTQLHLRFT